MIGAYGWLPGTRGQPLRAVCGAAGAGSLAPGLLLFAIVVLAPSMASTTGSLVRSWA